MSYTKLKSCPLTPECATTARLFRDDDTGAIVRFDAHDNDFRPHTCSVRNPASVKPVIVYLGEWLNHRTGRTRYIGPTRMRKSAEMAPKDEKYKNRGGSDPSWELKRIWQSLLTWEPVEDGETGKK